MVFLLRRLVLQTNRHESYSAKDFAIRQGRCNRFATPSSMRTLATNTDSAANNKGNKGDDESSLSYFDRKAAMKQQRVEAYQHKLQREIQQKHRRDNAPKDILKNDFRSWWDKRQAYEEIMDRKAKQAGREWEIHVATIVERLPIVLPDKMDFEKDFEDLQAYIKSHSGKEYPTEFTGTKGGDLPEALTDEELIAMLPENYRPAPRETKADEDGSTNTLDRKLKDRLYLVIDNSFPTTKVEDKATTTDNRDEDSESLLDAALRGLQEHITGSDGKGKKSKSSKGKDQLPLDLYCPSQAPLAVKLDVYDESKQQSTGFYGVKTFFMKVQYDDGKIKNDVDFAWLDRSEIVTRIQDSIGKEEAKFYRYVL